MSHVEYTGLHTDPNDHVVEENGADVGESDGEHYAPDAREDGATEGTTESCHEDNRRVVCKRYRREHWKNVQLQTEECGVPVAVARAQVVGI